MDEASRFLRYVIPGLVSVLVTFVLLVIMDSCAAIYLLRKINTLDGVAVGIGAILASGAVGFVYANIYFALMNCWDFLNHNHLSLFRGAKPLIVVKNALGQTCTVRTRQQAWILMCHYWTSLIERPSGKDFRGTDPFAGRLTHHMHSHSATAIGVYFSLLYCAVLISIVDNHNGVAGNGEWRLALCLFTWLVLQVIFWSAHVRTKRSLEGVVHALVIGRLVRAARTGKCLTLYYNGR